MKTLSSSPVRLLALTLILGAITSLVWLEIRSGDDDLADLTRHAEPEAGEIHAAIGAEAYTRRLSGAVGQPLDGQALADAARAAAERYETRLDALAAEIADTQLDDGLAAPDWRRVFAELERDHAANGEAVLEAYRVEIERQARFLEPLDLVPEPSQPIRVTANENPAFRRYFPLAMYLDGLLAVTLEPPGDTPNDDPPNDDAPNDDAPNDDKPVSASRYLVNHCRTCIPPLVAHEVMPGHHVAYSVAAEVLPEGPRRLAANRQNVVYHEGWGLYAEHLMLELGYYDGDPAGELAAVRLLYLRALRAWIDPALHGEELSAGEAIEIYRQRANLGAPAGEAEIARHFKDPVLKASYFIGLRQILELRRHVLGADPSPEKLRAFHRRFLGEPRPIPTIAREVFDVELPSWTEQGARPSPSE